jgi:hypothetical protein
LAAVSRDRAQASAGPVLSFTPLDFGRKAATSTRMVTQGSPDGGDYEIDMPFVFDGVARIALAFGLGGTGRENGTDYSSAIPVPEPAAAVQAIMASVTLARLSPRARRV